MGHLEAGRWIVRLSAMARAADPVGAMSTGALLRLIGKTGLLLTCGALPWILILWAFGAF